MNQLVTPGFLFRWSFPVPKLASLPNRSGQLLDLPDTCRLPSLSELDSRRDFAEIRLAWNSDGFGVSALIRGKTKKPDCSALSVVSSDGLTIWIDTRNTQGVHRATKFCHQFCLLPLGGRKSSPVVTHVPLARAREEAILTNTSQIQLHSEIFDDGYLLEAWFPSNAFVGFDPSTSPRLGFHYLVRDRELGEQSLVVGSEFPVASDPSLWQTLELAGA
jgi:hypothetical protein